ncbi:hypothetical protein BH10ACI4_BH10ACI4_07540 [soil metagenome]
MMSTSAACAKLFWSVMGSVAGSVTLLVGTNAPSSSTIGLQGNLFSI